MRKIATLTLGLILATSYPVPIQTEVIKPEKNLENIVSGQQKYEIKINDKNKTVKKAVHHATKLKGYALELAVKEVKIDNNWRDFLKKGNYTIFLNMNAIKKQLELTKYFKAPKHRRYKLVSRALGPNIVGRTPPSEFVDSYIKKHFGKPTRKKVRITFYDGYDPKQNGFTVNSNLLGKTSSGEWAVMDVSVAADKCYPEGTIIYIKSLNWNRYRGIFRVEDIGSAVKGCYHLDVFSSNSKKGTHKSEVHVLKLSSGKRKKDYLTRKDYYQFLRARSRDIWKEYLNEKIKNFPYQKP